MQNKRGYTPDSDVLKVRELKRRQRGSTRFPSGRTILSDLVHLPSVTWKIRMNRCMRWCGGSVICTVEHRHEVCIYNAPLDACYGGYSSIIRIGLPLARETASPSSSTTLANTRSSSSGPRPPSSLAPRWKPTMLALNWSTWSRKLRT